MFPLHNIIPLNSDCNKYLNSKAMKCQKRQLNYSDIYDMVTVYPMFHLF